MTQEDKELLLKDLSARLPYGVKCYDFHYDNDGNKIDDVCTLESLNPTHKQYKYVGNYSEHDIGRIKPYLRPMSSMTDEEKDELWKAIDKDTDIIMANIDAPIISIHKGRVYRGELIHYEREFLISHHFDYSGLIPMGLALEAPEEMYK